MITAFSPNVDSIAKRGESGGTISSEARHCNTRRLAVYSLVFIGIRPLVQVCGQRGHYSRRYHQAYLGSDQVEYDTVHPPTRFGPLTPAAEYG